MATKIDGYEYETAIVDVNEDEAECARCHQHIRGGESVWRCGERFADEIFCSRSCAVAGPQTLEQYMRAESA